MNIKITYNWLLEYLDTDATPYDIQKYLSLCGPSVESVEKVGSDYIFDIEITSNRIDTASVIGIAREACVILNRFGIKSKLKNVIIPKPNNVINTLPLIITDENKLCFRVVSVAMDNVITKNSPKYIKDRLEAIGIRSLNNIIDITNYVMIEYGHPTHVMDYDRIKTGKLIIRRAKKGETSVTLDGKKHNLDEQDVIADDGTGRIVDLLGIMGCENSVVTPDTKRVILFIESNNPHIIRHTSMKLGIRTVAATYDDKQVDSELTGVALNRLIQLFEELAEAKIASKLIDIYHEPKKPKSVSLKESDIERLIGVKIPKKESIEILSNLEFKLISDKNELLTFRVPSFRSHDINIPEDIIEEVARVYGYQNIPSVLQPIVYVDQPKEMEDIFVFQNRIKIFLKHLGLNEVINYSMISKNLILDSGLKIDDHLRLSNSISTDIEFLRISLLPSLYKNIKDNSGRKEFLKFFEIAKVYLPKKGDLPEEVYRLGIAVNTNYLNLKGIVEALARELNNSGSVFDKNSIQGKDGVYTIEIDLKWLINNSCTVPDYKPIHPYAVIKLDKTFDLSPNLTYEVILRSAQQSKLLQKVEVLTLYKNKLTLRFYYSLPERNITEEEAKNELEKLK
ncbi:MAG: Phenylalanine-tRNA ligase beta subunit [Candidatus Roizmanbacteria bacterium GW2011_GWA2_35_8]|uniref:phenylalanine--tRNA ligase n=1 Tax=Candidatus Roizmanbacteria bacterium GW2011_GWA2_35_8 TaxID=1618479 RepID=A0A0G0CXV5_9BACT|nr:MAG: Phenylalanine-tRNA ligase beta subunit [Candidatus Roizmanbacteria bacterium GW2011_GWA2_35_8]